jgi:hypothetical protein
VFYFIGRDQREKNVEQYDPMSLIGSWNLIITYIHQ